ncbi:hypothetical protein IPV08_08295 [Methylobacterium sp. SD274]|jgi:hypothetical protein|uniref:Uncharacterized protein n=1 Tax=Methylobacterium gossipiicola TaxID=582675 RepID=A0A1I2V2I8_9HYPH|nr:MULTISPECIES: hypothetical protein [Methylobacterium]MBO1019963.1 hypothetical protein [Methylobacterium sp. SD274]SFG82447.1 hypothetical protein SAMN05192565_112107 [Methylobacterium gossipiicola]
MTRRALHGLPRPAAAAFRRNVTLARAGEASPELAAAFEAVGVTNFMRPSVTVFDDVADVLPLMRAGERTEVEAALFGGLQ